MILNTSEEFVFSSLGWKDGGTIWALDVNGNKPTSIHVGSARYVSLQKGSNDHFSIAHHSENDKFLVSVHKANKTAEEVARVSIGPDGIFYGGDAAGWLSVPKAYVSYFEFRGVQDYWLCIVGTESDDTLIKSFRWYDETYDKGYQGIIGVVEVPDSKLVIVSVQRDSSPVLYDPILEKAIRKIDLANRYGNPKLQFNSSGTDLWADDYDTLLKIAPTTWSVEKSSELQTTDNGTRSFIGDYWLNNDETLCIVPRPFSNDVIGVDANTFKIKYECNIGKQPLQAVMLSDGRVIARDWRSGELLNGQMKKTSRFRFFN